MVVPVELGTTSIYVARNVATFFECMPRAPIKRYQATPKGILASESSKFWCLRMGSMFCSLSLEGDAAEPLTLAPPQDKGRIYLLGQSVC